MLGRCLKVRPDPISATLPCGESCPVGLALYLEAQTLQQVHWLAVSPVEDIKNTVKYARICRKAGKRDLAIKIQALAMNSDNGDPLNLTVVVSTSKNDWRWHEIS